MNFETSAEIEVAIALHFGITTHVSVPNVSWGMFGYELDLCVLNIRSLYASEVEIKISKSDLKRDAQKHHDHDRHGNLIRNLYFAMPEKMKGCDLLVPARAGVLYVSKEGRVTVARTAEANRLAKKWSYEQAFKLARLGSIRTWNLKKNNLAHYQKKAKL